MAEARLRFGALVRALLWGFLLEHGGRLEAMVGGPFDLVLLVPSTHRPGLAPLAHVDGLGRDLAGALPAARWEPGLLRRAENPGGPPPVAHMRPDPAAFMAPRTSYGDAPLAARALLLDDIYVSGARIPGVPPAAAAPWPGPACHC